MKAAPKWAQDLVLQVAIDEGRDNVPELVWRSSSKNYMSSGRAWPALGRILITAGRSRTRFWYLKHRRRGAYVSGLVDQKLVLLHELAHWLRPATDHHSAAFWDKAWELYRRYRVPILYARQREGSYRKGAVAAYARSRGKANGPSD